MSFSTYHVRARQYALRSAALSMGVIRGFLDRTAVVVGIRDNTDL